MAVFSRIRTQILSWSQNTPLPVDEPDAKPTFQAWHEFDTSTQRWSHVDGTRTSKSQKVTGQDSELVLVTWNVDSTSALPELRISAIMSHIINLAPAVDIIFFQEVSRAALAFLLDDAQTRESWFLSDADATSWERQSFASMTLLSKSRFAVRKTVGRATLGPVWRVKYPSRFGRDALCCDVFVSSSRSTASTIASDKTRIRLVNVHLDSLPIKPSRRPQQISIIASFLRSADRGVVAGDFNPVLPEDETLVEDNRLVDAWVKLHHKEAGFTWGVDGKQPFPPNRLDKVAILGIKAQDIEVMHPDVIRKSSADVREITQAADNTFDPQQHDSDELVPWSDHSGLRCSFGLAEP